MEEEIEKDPDEIDPKILKAEALDDIEDVDVVAADVVDDTEVSLDKMADEEDEEEEADLLGEEDDQW